MRHLLILPLMLAPVLPAHAQDADTAIEETFGLGTGPEEFSEIEIEGLTAERLVDAPLMGADGARIGTVAQEAPAGQTSVMDFVLAADLERTALLAEAETATDPHRIADIQTRLADIDAHSAEARAGAILNGLGFNTQDQARAGPGLGRAHARPAGRFWISFIITSGYVSPSRQALI